MALSLDDIKKNKTQRSAKKARPKSISKEKNQKTKPWEKPIEAEEISFKSPNLDQSLLLEKALVWGKKIKLFPIIDIPVPDFLLTKDED